MRNIISHYSVYSSSLFDSPQIPSNPYTCYADICSGSNYLINLILTNNNPTGQNTILLFNSNNSGWVWYPVNANGTISSVAVDVNGGNSYSTFNALPFYTLNNLSIPLTTPGYYTLMTIYSTSYGGGFSNDYRVDGCNGVLHLTTDTPLVSTSIFNESICPGDSINISASGCVTYSWSPSLNINTTTGANVIVSPTINTTYTVTGTNDSGCVATSFVTIQMNSSSTVLEQEL